MSGISDVSIVITSQLILSLACSNVNQGESLSFMIIIPFSWFLKNLPSTSILDPYFYIPSWAAMDSRSSLKGQGMTVGAPVPSRTQVTSNSAAYFSKS